MNWTSVTPAMTSTSSGPDRKGGSETVDTVNAGPPNCLQNATVTVATALTAVG